MTKTVRANGIDIRYEVQGAGPWVLFAHSLASDLSIWDEQAAALSDRYTVLRCDLRGHGGSSAPEGAYEFPTLVGDIVGLLDALAVAAVDYVGISMGGMLGQHLALAAPERVRRLALVSTTSRIPPEGRNLWDERIAAVSRHGLAAQVGPTLERWFTAPFRAAHPEIMERIGGLIGGSPLAGYIGWGRAIATLDVTACLAEIRCPTLVIAGRQDAGTPPAAGRAIADHIPAARFELLDASHLCNIEQAAAFNRLLQDFLG